MGRSWGLLASLLLLATARGLPAQDLIRTHEGEAAADRFSAAAAVVGDLDGDATDDLLVGAPGSSVTAFHSGSAYAYSGRDGALIRRWRGAAIDDLFGTCITAADDFDGDGVVDLLIGAPNYAGSVATGTAWLYSGATGALLHQFVGASAGSAFGHECVRLDDLDGDGKRELAIGAYGAAQVDVYSGQDGALLLQLQSPQPTSGMGFAIERLDDVDGDGTPDFVVSSPFWVDDNGATCGLVEIRSGRDGTVLHALDGENDSPFLNDFFGFETATIADVDGDGLDDLAVGAFGFGACQAGRVYLYSGTGGLLRTVDGDECGDQAGLALASAGDVDGDGAGDLLVGTPNRGGNLEGRVSIRSGASLAELAAITGSADTRLGSTLDDRCDLDHDGVAELVLGTTGADANDAGMLFIYALRAPRIDLLAPPRGNYRADAAITVTGASFHPDAGFELLVDGAPASDLVVVDEQTLTFTIASGDPALVDVEVRDLFGGAHATFQRTPTLTAAGDFRPGGVVQLSSSLEPGDTILLLAGLPPGTAIVVPPYAGTLNIDPCLLLAIVASAPSDVFAFDLPIPDDPGYSGLTILFQELVGPQVAGRHKDGAWTNLVSVTID